MIKVYASSTEITNPLKNGLNTAVSIDVLIGNTDIEVKSEKPLSKIYFDITCAHDGSLSLLYFNGVALSSVTDVNDSTIDLKSPGFISWVNESDNAVAGGLYRYVFRISGVTADVVASLKFVGMIFSEDFDLKNEYPGVSEYLYSPDTSFVRFHVAAKDDIVSYFRGRGKRVDDTEPRDITEFDFLEPEQIRTASKFITLSKIFFMASDAVEDKYYEMFKDYKNQGYGALDLFYLTLDEDGDGAIDTNEKAAIQPLIIHRV